MHQESRHPAAPGKHLVLISCFACVNNTSICYPCTMLRSCTCDQATWHRRYVGAIPGVLSALQHPHNNTTHQAGPHCTTTELRQCRTGHLSTSPNGSGTVLLSVCATATQVSNQIIPNPAWYLCTWDASSHKYHTNEACCTHMG